MRRRLIIEMTGNYEQMLPLLISCFCAYAVVEYLHSLRIYEALLERDRCRGQHRHALAGPMVLELDVQPCAPFDGRLVPELGLPPGCTLVRVRGREWIPTAETRPEDHMRITVVIAPEAASGLSLPWRDCAEAEEAGSAVATRTLAPEATEEPSP